MSLDGDIQRRNGFIGHDKLRIHGQGPGNGDALALAPGKFVRIAVLPTRVDPHLLHDLGYLLFNIAVGKGVAVKPDRLLQGLPHTHTGIERSVRVLENHLHACSVWLDGVAGKRINAFAAVENLSRLGWIQPHHRPGQGRFSATGLPHHTDRLALMDIKTDAIDCLNHGFFACHPSFFKRQLLQPAAGDIEMFDQVLDAYQNRCFHEFPL